MAMGAYQALVAAGKDRQVKVFGFDGATMWYASLPKRKSLPPACSSPSKWPARPPNSPTNTSKANAISPKKSRQGGPCTQQNVHRYGDYGKKQ
jgi:ribose transport system substrate-binding protein